MRRLTSLSGCLKRAIVKHFLDLKILTSSVSFGLLWVDERVTNPLGGSGDRPTASTGSGSERGNINFLNLKFNELNFRVKVEAAPNRSIPRL